MKKSWPSSRASRLHRDDELSAGWTASRPGPHRSATGSVGRREVGRSPATGAGSVGLRSPGDYEAAVRLAGPNVTVRVASGGREGVQGGLSPDHPLCPTSTGRVQGTGHQVQTLHRRLLCREVLTSVHRAAVAGVERLDRVGRADDPPDLDVELQEWRELRPR